LDGVNFQLKAGDIHAIKGELAKQGLAIIMIPSEMPEIRGMGDRVYVLCDGRVTGGG
jgi:ABC-type sugar transport system ATPase subunit